MHTHQHQVLGTVARGLLRAEASAMIWHTMSDRARENEREAVAEKREGSYKLACTSAATASSSVRNETICRFVLK